MKAARTDWFGDARVVRAGMIATAMATNAASAAAMCPPPKSEAQHLADGAVVFSGRVRAIGPEQLTGRAGYYDFDVVDGPAGVLRVHTPDQAMYTASFERGRLYRVVAFRGKEGLSTFACVNKPL